MADKHAIDGYIHPASENTCNKDKRYKTMSDNDTQSVSKTTNVGKSLYATYNIDPMIYFTDSASKQNVTKR